MVEGKIVAIEASVEDRFQWAETVSPGKHSWKELLR